MKFRRTDILGLFIQYSLFIILALTLLSCGNSNDTKERKENKIPKEPEFLYGICIDSFDVKIDTIRRNQFLSNIMLKENIDYNIITHIEKNHRKVFDIRKIKPGQRHTFLIKRDSIATPAFWIYEINKVDYAVFSLTDSLNAWVGHKKVDTKVEFIEGVIETSLWNAMEAAGGNQNITMELSEIYSWTVDFFGIQPGDTFKVVYENKYIKDECIGMGKILLMPRR